MNYNQDEAAENKEKEAMKHAVNETVEKILQFPLPVQNEYLRAVFGIITERRLTRMKELDDESNQIKESFKHLESIMAERLKM